MQKKFFTTMKSDEGIAEKAMSRSFEAVVVNFDKSGKMIIFREALKLNI